MAYSFFKTETKGLREQVTFIGNRLEAFIPTSFFDSNFATNIGNNLEVLGMFWFRVDGRMYELKFPVKLMMGFTDTRTEKGFRLALNIPAADYTVYVLHNGDPFIVDRNYQVGLDPLQFFLMKIIEGGKIPAYIAYSDVANIFFDALIASDIKTGLSVPAVSLEFLLSEQLRTKANMSNPFRKNYNGKNDYAYKMVKMTKIPQLSSTFSSLIGEDSNNQLVNSVLRTREGKTEIESPIEKIIKY